jgi:hypothetical protein
MREALTAVDIRNLLISFDAAIELDQLRVDALPPECFHPAYSDSMWRLWRCLHRAYIKELLATVNAIPLGMLEGLTWIALNYDPAVVGDVMLDLFADAASGSCCELETATLFFGWLIKDLRDVPLGKPRNETARALMVQWLPVTDPLRIAEDEECGYGTPAGLVS